MFTNGTFSERDQESYLLGHRRLFDDGFYFRSPVSDEE